MDPIPAQIPIDPNLESHPKAGPHRPPPWEDPQIPSQDRSPQIPSQCRSPWIPAQEQPRIPLQGRSPGIPPGSPSQDRSQTDVHDAVLLGVEEEPVVEQRQLRVGGSHVGLGETKNYPKLFQGDAAEIPSKIPPRSPEPCLEYPEPRFWDIPIPSSSCAPFGVP